MAPVTTKEHLSKHDREIAAIRKLILTGMKMLNGVTEAHRRLAVSQERLAASQEKTDRELQLLIRSLRGGGNGHGKRPILH